MADKIRETIDKMHVLLLPLLDEAQASLQAMGLEITSELLQGPDADEPETVEGGTPSLEAIRDRMERSRRNALAVDLEAAAADCRELFHSLARVSP
jgi:hypothetical protein